MNPLYTQEEFDNAKGGSKLSLKCYYCHNTFFKEKKFILQVINNIKKNNCQYCNRDCHDKAQITKQKVICKQCNKEFIKKQKEIKKSKSGNHFCSQSCAGTYNTTHKTHGTRRSKLENWLEEQLTLLYPNLQINFNKKDAIESELDIYIPSLKLAFELNGIFHYEPIYGQDKLNQIKNNDHRKFAACIEKKISFCIIDTSNQKYFKISTSQKYLDIIVDILKRHL